MNKASFKADRCNPYPLGSLQADWWQRGFDEAHIAELFDVPLELILPVKPSPTLDGSTE